MQGSVNVGRQDTFRCAGCGLKFALGDSTECSYHPSEAVHVGTSDARENYAEVWRFPCCGEHVLESYARIPGCVRTNHAIASEQVEALSALRAPEPKLWGAWRAAHPTLAPDFESLDLQGLSGHRKQLSGANFRDADLSDSDFAAVDLSAGIFEGAVLVRAKMAAARLDNARLVDANLASADLCHAHAENASFHRAWLAGAVLRKASLRGADFSLMRTTNPSDDKPSVDFGGADLTQANFTRAMLRQAALEGATLVGADLSDADMVRARLDGATLDGADLRGARLTGASLRGATLRGARLAGCDLVGACLAHADLVGVDLRGANLTRADLTGAQVRGADLREAMLLESNLTDACLVDSRVYGVAAWGVCLERTQQQDLVISNDKESVITVDDLEVAQFIYLMLNKNRIRSVIDSITSKGVLILGRFADASRKAVLDGLRDQLRSFDLLPMVFDFDRPSDKDYTETIQTLAGMSMFVIADVTSPKSTPLELEALVKQFKIPYLPIIDTSVDPRPFAMLVDLQKSFHWVLPTLAYTSREELLDRQTLHEYLIAPALNKREELRVAKNAEPQMVSIRRKAP